MQAPSDIPAAHRWFAVEANNRAWDLVEAPTRSPEETSEMLHTAHAALWHWQAVGTPLNRLRALQLLTTVYCVAEIPHSAIYWSREMLKELTHAADSTPFDRAGTLAAAAWTYQLLGDVDIAQELARDASDHIAQLTDAGESSLLTRIYAKGFQV